MTRLVGGGTGYGVNGPHRNHADRRPDLTTQPNLSPDQDPVDLNDGQEPIDLDDAGQEPIDLDDVPDREAGQERR